MVEQDELKILFVINLGSGNTKSDWEVTVREYFEPKGVNMEVFLVDGNYESDKLKMQISSFKPSKVIAVGGDGTVSLVAKQLIGTGIALGIIAAGSANGMAKELALPTAVEEQMNLIVNGKIRDADVIRINNDKICLHLSDIGLNAKLIKHFEEGKLRGKVGYATKVIKTLWTKSSIRVKMITDDQEVTHKAFMVVLANARMYGTGAIINPDGDLYDGKFEVVIIRKIAVSEIIKMLLIPRPYNPNKIKVFSTTEVSITTNKPAHFQVDGEYLGKVKKVEASILKGQLKLIVP